jgi:hypothetical protein
MRPLQDFLEINRDTRQISYLEGEKRPPVHPAEYRKNDEDRLECAPVKFRLRSGLQSTGPWRLGLLESILSSIEPAGQSEVSVGAVGKGDCADIDGIKMASYLRHCLINS